MKPKRPRALRFPRYYALRTRPETLAALERALAALRLSGRITIGGKPTLSREALTNAAWVWMDHMIATAGTDGLEAALAPAIARLNEILEPLPLEMEIDDLMASLVDELEPDEPPQAGEQAAPGGESPARDEMGPPSPGDQPGGG